MYTAREVTASYSEKGPEKAGMPAGAVIALGILAGVILGLAGVASTAAAVTVENASVAKLISACVFPAGLIIIIVSGAELFTGNCLLIIPALSRRISAGLMLRKLALVYIANLIGCMLVAAAVVYGHTLSMFGGAFAASVINAAVSKVGLSFGDAFIRGILCNICVCLAVWCALAAKDVAGKILAIFFPIAIFIVAGYEHCVANMYYIPAGLFAITQPEYLAAAGGAEGLTWGAFIVKNLIPVTLGNIVGGMLLGVCFWFASLRGADKPEAASRAGR